MPRLCCLVYISKPQINGPEDIKAILSASRRNNEASAITGTLLYTADWFVQVLEGGQTNLTKTFGRIFHDPRHSDVVIRDFSEIEQRSYRDWGMSYVSHDIDSLDTLRHFYTKRLFNPSEMSPVTLKAFCVEAVNAST